MDGRFGAGEVVLRWESVGVEGLTGTMGGDLMVIGDRPVVAAMGWGGVWEAAAVRVGVGLGAHG